MHQAEKKMDGQDTREHGELEDRLWKRSIRQEEKNARSYGVLFYTRGAYIYKAGRRLRAHLSYTIPCVLSRGEKKKGSPLEFSQFRSFFCYFAIYTYCSLLCKEDTEVRFFNRDCCQSRAKLRLYGATRRAAYKRQFALGYIYIYIYIYLYLYIREQRRRRTAICSRVLYSLSSCVFSRVELMVSKCILYWRVHHLCSSSSERTGIPTPSTLLPSRPCLIISLKSSRPCFTAHCIRLLLEAAALLRKNRTSGDDVAYFVIANLKKRGKNKGYSALLRV